MNILICEDDTRIASNLGHPLRHLGHHVSGTASDPAQCLEMVFLTQPDLVLVNLGDGRIGVGLAEALMRLGLPSVLVAGATEDDVVVPFARVVLGDPLDEEHLAGVLADIEQERQERSSSDPLTGVLTSHHASVRVRPRRLRSDQGRRGPPGP